MGCRFKIKILYALLAAAVLVNTAAVPVETASEAVENLAVVLLIDTSSSMGRSDPAGLSVRTAALFTELLEVEDYLGILTFSEEVRTLIPLQQLSDPAVNVKLKEILEQDFQPAGYTDYRAALEAVLAEFAAVETGERCCAVILFTDGEPEPDRLYRNDPAWMESYLDSLRLEAAVLVLKQLPLFTVGLSEETDPVIMRQLSALTGGEYQLISETSALPDAVNRLFEKLKESRPAERESGTSHGNAFGSPLSGDQPGEGINFPQPVTDFHPQKDYRFGEEELIEANLHLGGNRLTENDNLQIKRFELLLLYPGGEKISIPLLDNGREEQGDLTAGDGIYSTYFSFDCAGKSTAGLIVSGFYRDEEFFLVKNLGSFTVHPPGQITTVLLPAELRAVPGGVLRIPLQVENRSELPETLLLDCAGADLFRLKESKIRLEAGEVKKVLVEVMLSRQLENGPLLLPLSLKAGHPLSSTDPALLELPVNLFSPGRYFAGCIFGLLKYAPVLLLSLLAAGVLIRGGGSLLYRFLLLPYLSLGELCCRMDQNGASAGGRQHIYKLKLGRDYAQKAVVSLNRRRTADDFLIQGGAFEHELLFYTQQPKSPSFMRGWQALFSRGRASLTAKFVECTPPGVIEFEGGIATRKELFHDDEFKSGDFIFKYIDPHARKRGHEGDSTNLLNGKA